MNQNIDIFLADYNSLKQKFDQHETLNTFDSIFNGYKMQIDLEMMQWQLEMLFHTAKAFQKDEPEPLSITLPNNDMIQYNNSILTWFDEFKSMDKENRKLAFKYLQTAYNKVFNVETSKGGAKKKKKA
jgi:hypothetical protein